MSQTQFATDPDETTSFDTNYAVYRLDNSQSKPTRSKWGGMWVNLTGCVSNPATMTYKVSSDALGDHLLVPETAGAVLRAGQTTSTTMTMIADFCDLTAPGAHVSVYVWLKSNTGSGTVSSIIITATH